MERPIIFSAPMVRAILEGRKTQTRRVVKRLTHDAALRRFTHAIVEGRCPYGRPGDRLWVRETWAPYHGADEPVRELDDADCVRYAADGAVHMAMHDGVDQDPLDAYGLAPHVSMPGGPWKWRPSIHMPRWASRITLDVVDVRVERLCSISAADAADEGVDVRTEFVELWESINGAGSWGANPWVWVVTFKRVST